nr:immunoglobulin light chain junction region [Macaca mulatta]MOW04427.1 immunoglobulin light chain junction region [Macaca mulatta]MOW04542.1 immunoglobulin light chain junction region [Macaca mulatta]MOW04739.1 immunoglobulin light chain junction region [Macaca mulatta]MOW04828.1 immunoglobulin light chain junction region [Macaca mulatta]
DYYCSTWDNNLSAVLF